MCFQPFIKFFWPSQDLKLYIVGPAINLNHKLTAVQEWCCFLTTDLYSWVWIQSVRVSNTILVTTVHNWQITCWFCKLKLLLYSYCGLCYITKGGASLLHFCKIKLKIVFLQNELTTLAFVTWGNSSPLNLFYCSG